MRIGKGIGDIEPSFSYFNGSFSVIEGDLTPRSIPPPATPSGADSRAEKCRSSKFKRLPSPSQIHVKNVLSRISQPIDLPPNRPCKTGGGKNTVQFAAEITNIEKALEDPPTRIPPPVFVANVVDIPPDLCGDLGLGNEEPEEDVSVEGIDINPDLPENEMSLFRGVLHKFRRVFRPAWGLLNDGSSMEIKVKPGTEPITQAPFRNSPRSKAVIDKMMDEMISKGRARPSSSPWSSPVFTVVQHGAPRLLIDFRKVNDVVERDMYPLPRQDDIFAAVAGARYITTFDVQKGFYQIPLSESSKKYTAFASHRGLEELTVSVMGFKNSPSFFQRKMDQLLARWRWQSVIAYIDDLIIWSNDAEQHAKDVANVLEALDKVNLTLNPSKAHVGYFETSVLGHKVGRLGLGTTKEKTEAMINLRRPQTLKELEMVIGTFGYYRHFIPNFAQVASALYDAKTRLTSKFSLFYKKQDRPLPRGKPTMHYDQVKSHRLEWTEECETSFKKLKDILSSATVLMAPIWDEPFILYCDASYDGYGAALHQIPKGCERKRRNERPILYLSRGLSKHEDNYAPTELECGCLVWAIGKLSHYLDGADMEVVTDHSALQWILKLRETPSTRHNNRLLRWSIFLSQYAGKMKITHRAGAIHGNVDGLSRLISKVANEDVPIDSSGASGLSSKVPSHDTPVLWSEFEIDSNKWIDSYKSDPSL